jgi:hypothetical protein
VRGIGRSARSKRRVSVFQSFSKFRLFLPHKRSDLFHEISPLMPFKTQKLAGNNFFLHTSEIFSTTRLNRFFFKQLTDS